LASDQVTFEKLLNPAGAFPAKKEQSAEPHWEAGGPWGRSGPLLSRRINCGRGCLMAKGTSLHHVTNCFDGAGFSFRNLACRRKAASAPGAKRVSFFSHSPGACSRPSRPNLAIHFLAAPLTKAGRAALAGRLPARRSEQAAASRVQPSGGTPAAAPKSPPFPAETACSVPSVFCALALGRIGGGGHSQDKTTLPCPVETTGGERASAFRFSDGSNPDSNLLGAVK